MGPKWKIVLRRTLRYIVEPQGLAAGVLLVLLGVPLFWWTHRGHGVRAVLPQVLIVLAPLAVWLGVIFAIQYFIVSRDATVKRLELVGGGPFETTQNGWRLVVAQTDGGIIRFSVGLADTRPYETWAYQWRVLDPYWDEHRMVTGLYLPIGSGANPLSIAAWPVDFFGGGYANGEHSVAWVVNGVDAVQQTFTTKVHRGSS